MPPNLRINLLGQLRLSANGNAITAIKSERLQALLAFLLLHCDIPQPRSHIAVQLWPDSTDANAKANLRKRLHDLKKHIPESDRLLKTQQQTIRWITHEDCWVDVLAFEAAIVQANAHPEQAIRALESAVELYKGELLPSCYDDWIEPYRDRLRQQAMTALDVLISQLAKQERVNEAIGYAQQLQQMDPLYEPAYFHLMRLYAKNGARAIALRTYHKCMTVLREELGVDPSSETRELHQTLLTGRELLNDAPVVIDDSVEPDISPISSSLDWGEAPDVSFFYGRAEEIDTLQTWIVSERARLVAVLGMGGIGKTTLVAKAIHQIKGEFDRVIWRSLRNAPPLETLLGEIIPFLSQQQDTACTLPRLMHWLRQSRCLLILDNLETLLNAKERAGQFQADYDNYRELIEVVGKSDHQSCLILTSREKPAEIATITAVSQSVRSLEIAGSPEASQALIEAKQLTGTPAQKEQLSQRYGHSPLALQIVGGSIRDIFSGDIGLFLAEDTLLFNGAKKLLDVQFARLIPLEKTVMFWLAINREWTSLAELMADIHPPCSKLKLLEAIESLSWRSLIETRANTYTQQPVVMECVTIELLSKISEELATSHLFEPSSQPTNKSNNSKSRYLFEYALLKTTVKDYIRDSQQRMIVQPIIAELSGYGHVPQRLILNHLEAAQSVKTQSYCLGNLLNLGRVLNVEFTQLDFSNQLIRQAYLQDVTLHQVNFTGATFHNTAFNQPAGPLFDVAFNHDGSLMVVSEGGGRLVVWCMETYKPKLILKDTSNWLLSVAFNYDGTYLVSEGADHQLVVWDVATGQCVQRMTGHSADIWEINAHPTENLIVSASADGTACIWDLTTGEQLQRLTGSSYTVRAAEFSPDGQRMVSGVEDGSLNIWDIKTGELLQNWQRPASIMSLSWSPDGRALALGYHTGEIDLWDMTTEAVEQSLSAHEGPAMALQFSPCGRYLASGSYRSSKLWEASTGRLLWTANDYGSWIWGLAFNPNNQYLAVVNHDQTVRLWEISQKRLLKTLPGFSSWVTAAKFHPERPILASCSSDGTARLWDIKTGDTLTVFEGHQDWIVGVDFSPCGQYLVTSSNDQTIKLWSMQTGKLLKTFTGHMSAVYGIHFSPDGQRLISSGLDLTLRLWDIATGQLLQILEYPDSAAQHGWILAIQLSPNQQYFATGGSDAAINFWDADTGQHQKRWQAHTAPVWAISFHPTNGQLASVGEDATVKVWNTETGELLQSLDGHTDSIYAASYSPNGQWLVTAGDDCAIKLWETTNYTLVKSLEHHQSRVTTLTFTADSQYLASGSIDETIAIWNIGADQPHRTLRAPRPYEGMNITGAQGLSEAQQLALITLGAVVS